MASQLIELDSVEIVVIVDNELDPISPSPNPAVQQSGGLKEVGGHGPDISSDASRPGAARELRMDNICCSAHGLSLMITGTKDGKSKTVLFDTGPEEHVWERNANRLRADIGKIEVIQLSHWHRDHSGGMLKVLDMIHQAKPKGSEPVRVDLHPRRPDYRGVHPPGLPVFSMEADPSFSEIEKVGAVVDKTDQPHTVCDDMFLVSGEIPRVTAYEKGFRFGVRYEAEKGKWEEDEKMADERFLMCKIKGKGILMFTGCSHAGVVNASRHAIELSNGAPLYAVMGGFHLADADAAKIEYSARDLKALDTKVLLAGHCTGWRAKFELQKIFPSGCLVPSFVGNCYGDAI